MAIGVPSMMSLKLIENKLEMRIPWLIRPFKRLIISVLLKVVVVFIILMLINYLFFFLIKGQNTREFFSNTLKGFKYASAIIIAGIVIENSIYFFRSWRQSAINEEILKREKLAIEYEALKNQVNPHFLFNSLSSLTTLVYKDQEKAATFIREFAGVYRYVLECRDKEIVDLATERKLLESMAYLYEIRHENSLQIKIDLPASEDKYVIPMALQMLLENAIKHNTLSPDSPLLIEIWADEEYVTVKNNMKPKIMTSGSSKIGLKNIQLRYNYLSDKKVVIDKTDKHFIIKIPLLTKENETSTNHRR
jgi:sensor histidine kinase YesM